MKRRYLYTIFTVILFMTPFVEASDTYESKVINNQGDTIGTIKLRQGTKGVLLEVKVEKLKPGLHGMHFHAVGNCDNKSGFKKAKGHILRNNKPHGFLHPDGPHAGNLPNLIVDESGKAHVEIYTELVSLNGSNNRPALFDQDGSTLIIHENPDDHYTQPIGGSGGRIGCSLIKK